MIPGRCSLAISNLVSGIRNNQCRPISLTPKIMDSKLSSNFCKNYSTSIFTTLSSQLEPRSERVFDCDLSYVQMDGNPNHVLFILPGALSSIEQDFVPLLQSLDSTKFKAIAYDPPGYGRSRPPNRWEVEGVVAERDAIYATELLEKYSLLGWSMGAFTASMMAVRNPERVRKLVVWGMGGYFDDVARKNLKMMESVGISCIPKARRLKLLEMYGEEGLEKIFHTWVSSEEDEAVKVGYSKDGPFTRECLNKISAPTLIIQGAKDGFLDPGQISYLHKNIKGSKTHLIKNGNHATHGPPSEDEFLSVVEKFLTADLISSY